MSAKKGLGRSFGSLLPTELLNEAFDPTASEDEKISELRQLAVSEITADTSQPRRHFDEEALNELAVSIKEHGVIQPIVVTPGKNGFVIVAGERRWRAATKVGLVKIPAIIRTLSDQHKLELSLIENLQRENLNSIETATAYLKLRDQFSLKLSEISARVGGKSITVISNTIRLLQLPDAAREALVQHKITEGHARQILALEKDDQTQTALLEHIIKEGWSVRRAEQFVIGYKKGEKGDKKVAAKAAVRSETPLTKSLAKRLKTEVRVKTTAKGGQLIISFKTEEDLERISRAL